MSVLRTRPTRKARRTRARILDAALGLFLERGFEPTSMRDIGEAAGLSVGSTYYHFRSKGELILAWYEQTQAAAEERQRETCERTASFGERMSDLLGFKLEQLARARDLVVVLSRNAVDSGNPLSPFSPETASIRDAAIGMMAEAIEGSDLVVHAAFRPRLPRLLWLAQMGLIFFWTHDRSRGQARSRLLIDRGLDVLIPLLKLSTLRIPGMGNLRARFLRVLEIFDDSIPDGAG